jgi:hypothetical protein
VKNITIALLLVVNWSYAADVHFGPAAMARMEFREASATMR